METEFKVIDAMTKNPVMVKPGTTVQECAKVMRDQNVGSLVVMEDNHLIGVLTEYDLVRKIVAEGKDITTTAVDTVMCRKIQTIDPNAKLFDAISMMAQLDIRHLPVVHEGEFFGFLTAKDILKIEPALFEILIDSEDLREEHRKPIYKDEDSEYYDNKQISYRADDDIE